MKTSDLRIGGTYELKTGQITTIKRISGHGWDQQVFVDCMLKLSHRPAGRYVPIARFAALVVRRVTRKGNRRKLTATAMTPTRPTAVPGPKVRRDESSRRRPGNVSVFR